MKLEHNHEYNDSWTKDSYGFEELITNYRDYLGQAVIISTRDHVDILWFLGVLKMVSVEGSPTRPMFITLLDNDKRGLMRKVNLVEIDSLHTFGLQEWELTQNPCLDPYINKYMADHFITEALGRTTVSDGVVTVSTILNGKVAILKFKGDQTVEITFN